MAIAAVARNGVIGSGAAIPWSLPADQARFKQLTLGHVLIMGRKTYESIGRPLPRRTTVVVSRDPTWSAAGVEVAADVPAALAIAQRVDPDGPVYVAGGGEIYRAALACTGRLEITEVAAEPDGDATFPAIGSAEWQETARESHDDYAFVTYRRR
ncbi:MAG: dihydrofolate reductase [Propionibacteriaceae bacterium]